MLLDFNHFPDTSQAVVRRIYNQTLILFDGSFRPFCFFDSWIRIWCYIMYLCSKIKLDIKFKYLKGKNRKLFEFKKTWSNSNFRAFKTMRPQSCEKVNINPERQLKKETAFRFQFFINFPYILSNRNSLICRTCNSSLRKFKIFFKLFSVLCHVMLWTKMYLWHSKNELLMYHDALCHAQSNNLTGLSQSMSYGNYEFEPYVKIAYTRIINQRLKIIRLQLKYR